MRDDDREEEKRKYIAQLTLNNVVSIIPVRWGIKYPRQTFRYKDGVQGEK